MRWDDPTLGIDWPVRDVTVSEKDRQAQTLAEWFASADSEKLAYAGQKILA
ncbi:MAG TPA: hypothetical protein VMW51_06510 [Terriglobia bacterium]|nr:hypothetical protein [Terriglobia bacterium]